MNSPTENAFRRVEQILDRLLQDALIQLNDEDISATDESAREFHYKNQFLTWSYRFESRRTYRGPEIALVTLRIRFDEPLNLDETHDVKIWMRCEVFQIGQLPRWEHTDEFAMPLADIMKRGIAELVRTIVSNGHTTIEGN